MIRYFISGLAFLFFFVLETSFFSSLPSIFAATPLVFAMGVYLIQHQGLLDGYVWILFYGLFLQLLHFTASPLPLLSLFVAGTASLLSARHLFSNRSLYGVFGCAIVGYICLVSVDVMLTFGYALGNTSEVLWSSFMRARGQEFIMLFVTTFILFALAGPMRKLFRLSSF